MATQVDEAEHAKSAAWSEKYGNMRTSGAQQRGDNTRLVDPTLLNNEDKNTMEVEAATHESLKMVDEENAEYERQLATSKAESMQQSESM